MARYTRSYRTTRRTTARKSTGYRVRPAARGRRTTRRYGRSGGTRSAQTVRIVIDTGAQSPAGLGPSGPMVKPGPTPRKAKF